MFLNKLAIRSHTLITLACFFLFLTNYEPLFACSLGTIYYNSTQLLYSLSKDIANQVTICANVIKVWSQLHYEFVVFKINSNQSWCFSIIPKRFPGPYFTERSIKWKGNPKTLANFKSLHYTKLCNYIRVQSVCKV